MAAKVALYDRILDRHGSPGVLGCGAERLLVTKGNVRRGSATRSSVMSAPNSPRLPTMSSPYALAAITALPVRDSSCRHRSIRGDKVLRKFHTQPTTCSDGVLGLHILQRNALVDNAGDQERHCPHSPGYQDNPAFGSRVPSTGLLTAASYGGVCDVEHLLQTMSARLLTEYSPPSLRSAFETPRHRRSHFGPCHATRGCYSSSMG